jgi:hypothetical protein
MYVESTEIPKLCVYIVVKRNISHCKASAVHVLVKASGKKVKYILSFHI